MNFGIYVFYFISNHSHLWNYTPLILAARAGHTEIVQLLLTREGIDINCKAIFNTIIIHKIHIQLF